MHRTRKAHIHFEGLLYQDGEPTKKPGKPTPDSQRQ